MFVEIKRDLDKKTSFDRLVGQIEGLDPRERRILVVLVGKTDAALLGRLKERYRPYLDEEEGKPMSIMVMGSAT